MNDERLAKTEKKNNNIERNKTKTIEEKKIMNNCQQWRRFLFVFTTTAKRVIYRLAYRFQNEQKKCIFTYAIKRKKNCFVKSQKNYKKKTKLK